MSFKSSLSLEVDAAASERRPNAHADLDNMGPERTDSASRGVLGSVVESSSCTLVAFLAWWCWKTSNERILLVLIERRRRQCIASFDSSISSVPISLSSEPSALNCCFHQHRLDAQIVPVLARFFFWFAILTSVYQTLEIFSLLQEIVARRLLQLIECTSGQRRAWLVRKKLACCLLFSLELSLKRWTSLAVLYGFVGS